MYLYQGSAKLTKNIRPCNGECFNLCPDLNGIPSSANGYLHVILKLLRRVVELGLHVEIRRCANNTKKPFNTNTQVQTSNLENNRSKQR